MFKKSILSLAVASSVVLTGCLDNGETGHNANPDYRIENPDFTGKTWPIFNPVTSALPVPNDLIFDQTAKDGTFAVTGDMTNPAIAALNSLSGASTSAPIDIRFSGHIDPASVDARAFLLKDQNDPTQGVIPNPNQNVFLIALDYASGDPVQGLSNRESPTIPLAVTAAMAAAGDPASGAALVQKAMSPDYEATVKQFSGDSFVRIQPLKPLNPRTRYVVVLTNGIKDMNGDAIVPSPAYANITDPNQGLGSNALAAVRNLMNGLWEPLATGYFALNNGVRTQLGLPALTDKNIALSYSFTTSNDEKVLRYIAEPSAWFNDQLTGFLRVSATKAIADAQTDLNQDGKVDYSDMKLAADGAVAGFPNDAIKAALGPVFAAPPPAGCQSLTGAVAIGCVSKALTAQFGPAISAAKARVTAIDSIRDATQVSAILSQFAQPGEVR
ncbi:MAG: hypothetical protein LPK85_04905, partial [Gammaproteobacteria bacterium]|nr:hypothetical protein [Gammaproteobacteria bacterium]